MIITNLEKAEALSKDQALLRKVKAREAAAGLIQIKVGKNKFVMMSPNATPKEIQAKIKKHNKP